MKKLNHSIVLAHLHKYSQYTNNPEWIITYSKIAPLKGERTAKLLLKYKDTRSKLLDLGCGIGLTLASLIKYFPKSVGCDIGNKEIIASRELLKKLGLKNKVIQYDGIRLPFKDHSLDVVTSIEVYEHVANIPQMLREIKRVLKPDGILHITTANKWWPIEPHYHLPFLSYLPKRLAEKYLRLTKRGKDYEEINLPSYAQFYQKVNKYFKVEDVTLNVIKNYKEYSLGKERGLIIPVIAGFLKITGSWGKITKLIDDVLIRASLGWLFIAYPKKIK